MINEAAKDADFAFDEGLALAHFFNDGKHVVILYDSEHVSDVLASSKDKISYMRLQGAVSGYIKYYKIDCGVNEITNSAAIKGYGPLLYDYVLAQHWTMSDRSSVSKKAQNVWLFYYENRSDVQKKPVSKFGCKGYFNSSEGTSAKAENALDHAYFAPQLKSNYNLLLKNHANVIRKVKGKYVKDTVEKALYLIGTKFFTDNYDYE